MATPDQTSAPTLASSLRSKIQTIQRRAKSLIYHKPIGGYTRLVKGLFHRFGRKPRSGGADAHLAQMPSTSTNGLSEEDKVGSVPRNDQGAPDGSRDPVSPKVGAYSHRARHHTHDGLQD